MPETIVIQPDAVMDEVKPNVTDPASFSMAVKTTPGLTEAMRRYLLVRMTSGSTAVAVSICGVAQDTVERTWRRRVPEFDRLEQFAVQMSPDGAVDLARTLAQTASPAIMERQVAQALASHTDLTDRQLMAQQRARDAVLKAAGLDQPPPPSAGTSIDEMALVLFRRIRTPALPSPSDS